MGARIEIAPTIDTLGHPGFEALFGAAVGIPVNFKGRSRHFARARAGLGAGAFAPIPGGFFTSAIDLDYLYWAGGDKGPSMHVVAGLRSSIRTAPNSDKAPSFYGFGGRFAIMPAVYANEAGWLVRHLTIGPELRIEGLWSNPPGSGRAIVGLPLVVEISGLAAGD